MKQAAFYWHELVTDKVDEARAFYADVFGWTTTEMPMKKPAEGVYTMFMDGDTPTAGMMDNKHLPEPLASKPPHWCLYMCIADVKATIQAVTAKGGTIVYGPLVIDGVGEFAVAFDTQGSPFGFFQPAESDKPTDS